MTTLTDNWRPSGNDKNGLSVNGNRRSSLTTSLQWLESYSKRCPSVSLQSTGNDLGAGHKLTAQHGLGGFANADKQQSTVRRASLAEVIGQNLMRFSGAPSTNNNRRISVTNFDVAITAPPSM